MTSKLITELSDSQKAYILNTFIQDLEEINRNCGSILGTRQILERLDDIAIKANYFKCPYCGK